MQNDCVGAPSHTRTRLPLTIFSRVAAHSLGFGAPAVAVAALDFDFIRGEGGRVPHDKRVSFHQMFPPVIVHTCLPVAHLVLKARAIVFDWRERLQTAWGETFSNRGG